MPSTGGRCRKVCTITELAMVKTNSAIASSAPSFRCTSSCNGGGVIAGTANDISSAGTNQLTSDGRNNRKKSANGTMFFCHTINVVTSPKGLKAPPALAATTTLIQPTATNFSCVPPTASTITPITSAVVILSATGEMKNASRPVSQKITRNENPRETSQPRMASKTLRSSSTLTYVIAASRNSSTSANSSR